MKHAPDSFVILSFDELEALRKAFNAGALDRLASRDVRQSLWQKLNYPEPIHTLPAAKKAGKGGAT